MQLSREELLKAYRDMATIRRFEERVQEEFSKGGIPGFVHLYAGEEAAAVGVCSHLGPQDYIASTHRGHGHSIAKGCDPVLMMQELFAKKGGLCGGKGGSMHIADLDQRHARRQRHRRRRAAARGRRGADRQDARPRHRRGLVHRRRRLQPGHHLRGDEHGGGAEAAGDLRVREQPVRRRHRRSTTRSAAATSPAAPPGSACPPSRSTATISSRCTRRRGEAVERARAGGGPSAIEVDTCRFYGHHSGDAQLYRGKDEVRRLREERDCLKHFRRRVGEAALLDGTTLDAVDAEVAALIDRAVETARAAAAARCRRDCLTDVYVSY